MIGAHPPGESQLEICTRHGEPHITDVASRSRRVFGHADAGAEPRFVHNLIVKIGRNAPCPCGSGKKYKRCCFSLREAASAGAAHRGARFEDARTIADRIMQQEAERIAKFGQVRAPVTIQHKGQQFVAVGSRLLFDARWKTFHDFLFTYIASVFEKEWFSAEISKPLEQQHPLIQWYHLLHEFGAARKLEQGKVAKIEAPPAQISALLSFAYDLYTLENYGLLPPRLIDRLKRKDQFQGARYEAFVAAALIRAGFTIALEDEGDLSTTHCEFTATHRATGKKYSVEAKSRVRTGFVGQAGPRKPLGEIQADINGLLVGALRKAAAHELVVFVDINVPPSETPLLEADWFNKIASQFERLAKNQQGPPLPPAFVFFTNFPYHFVEDDAPLRGAAVLFTGFNIPEFHGTTADTAAVQTKFAPILELHTSLLEHTAVPHDLT